MSKNQNKTKHMPPCSTHTERQPHKANIGNINKQMLKSLTQKNRSKSMVTTAKHVKLIEHAVKNKFFNSFSKWDTFTTMNEKLLRLG